LSAIQRVLTGSPSPSRPPRHPVGSGTGRPLLPREGVPERILVGMVQQ